MTAHVCAAPAGQVSDPTLATAKALPTGEVMVLGDTAVSFPNDGNTLLWFHAGAATSITFVGTNGASTSPIALTSGLTYVCGPFDRFRFNDGTGKVTANLSVGNAAHTAVVTNTHETRAPSGAQHYPFETNPLATDG